MPATPKKGRRFGGDAAHQRLMMANLVASLIAAEGIVTTEAKAKALRPIAEKVITKAKKGGAAQPPPGRGVPPRQGDGRQAVRRDRPALRRPHRRLHPHPQARPPPGRQRADGAHRARLSPDAWRRARDRCSTRRAPSGPVGPLVRVRLTGRLRRHRASAASPPNPGVKHGRRHAGRRRSSGCCGHPVELTVRRAHRRRRARVGPGRQLRRARRRRSTSTALQRSVNQLLRPGDRRARRAESPPPTSTPASRRRPRRYRYTVLNRPVPDPFLGPHRVARRPSRSTCAALRLACDPLIGEHDFSSFCRRPKAPRASSCRHWSGGCIDAAVGRPRRRACCASRSRPPPFCHQMVRSIVGTLSTSASARSGPATWRASSGVRTAPSPAIPPQPRASSSGKSSARPRSTVKPRLAGGPRRARRGGGGRGSRA